MTKRFTIEKSEWSSTREEQYRKDCESILFKSDAKLEVDGSDIFLIQNNQKTKISDSDKSKNPWYEAWLFLTNSFNK